MFCLSHYKSKLNIFCYTNFMAKSRTIVFIDGSNTYFAQKKSGFWLDWVKVRRFFEKQS